MAIETCFECQTAVEEDQGRWLILDRVEGEGFEWCFMCLGCVRVLSMCLLVYRPSFFDSFLFPVSTKKRKMKALYA